MILRRSKLKGDAGFFSVNRKVLSKGPLLTQGKGPNLRDVTQGRILLALSFIMMIVYFWALFLAPQNIKFLDRTIRDWALLIPVMIIVYLFLVVVAWIGWAMATTPPPVPSLGKKNPRDENKEGGKNSVKKAIISHLHIRIYQTRLWRKPRPMLMDNLPFSIALHKKS